MKRYLLAAGMGFLVILPFLPISIYFLHLVILTLVWAFIGTSWSLMGKFRLVSLGHGAFMGVAGYTTALLWNQFHMTPWLGIPAGIAVSLLLGFLIGYPSFRFRVVGHYFALVTLALGEVVRFSIIAARDVTGGSLGMTPERVQPPTEVSWYALQFADKRYYYFLVLACWVGGLLVWRWVNRSMSRPALEAISADEIASASIGIHVTAEKLKITLISAGMTGMGGILLGLYNQYLNPNTLSGIGISLEIVFLSVVGGMYSAPGPTIGAILTIIFRETLRIYFGVQLAGMAETIYGLLLILFIVFMPRGIYGFLEARFQQYFSTPSDGNPESVPTS